MEANEVEVEVKEPEKGFINTVYTIEELLDCAERINRDEDNL